MLGLFSVSNDVSFAGEDQGGIGTFVKGRLMMIEPAAGTPSPDWQLNGKRMDSTVYKFPATLVADLNPEMNEEKSAITFALDELVCIRDLLVQKVELGRAWEYFPLVPNSSTPLPLHTSLVHNVSTRSEQLAALSSSGDVICTLCEAKMGKKALRNHIGWHILDDKVRASHSVLLLSNQGFRMLRVGLSTERKFSIEE